MKYAIVKTSKKNIPCRLDCIGPGFVQYKSIVQKDNTVLNTRDSDYKGILYATDDSQEFYKHIREKYKHLGGVNYE